MPADRGGLDHGFAASRDPLSLASAVVVSAHRPTAQTVVLTVEPGIVGHAFPTGDPFRRLVIEVDAQRAGASLPVERLILARTIENRRAHGLYAKRVVTHDNRVGAADANPTLHINTPEFADSVLVWRVVYERLDQTVDVADPKIFGRTVVAHGRLAPPSQRVSSPPAR